MPRPLYCSDSRLRRGCGLACLACLLLCNTRSNSAQQPVLPGGPIPVGPSVSAAPAEISAFASRGLLTITLSESLANSFVARDVSERGPVRDRILGAEVTGEQSTRSQVSLDFVACPANSRMFLHLRGNTTNRTSSWTPQAVIRSEGCYQFQLSKQIDLEGLRIATRSPAAFLETRQRNIAANSPSDGIPVVGPLVSMVAFYTAEQRRPLAERIAAHRVTQQIGPRFNEEADAELAKLNDRLQSAQAMFAKGLASSSTISASQSTENLMQMSFGSAPADSAPLRASNSAALQITLHEQLVGDILSLLPLAGVSANDTEIDHVLTLLRQNPLGLLGSIGSGEVLPPTFARVQFVGSQPLTVKFVNTGVEATVVLGFQPVLGPEIPPQRIVMKFVPLVQGDTLRIEGEVVEIAPLDVAPGTPLAEATSTILRQQIAQRLEPFLFPAVIPLPGLERGPQGLRLTGVEVRQDWMVLNYEPETGVPPSPPLPELPTPSDAPAFPMQNR